MSKISADRQSGLFMLHTKSQQLLLLGINIFEDKHDMMCVYMWKVVKLAQK